jgi:outer membrane protein OmpA-like peptidoglycan-associated protein
MSKIRRTILLTFLLLAFLPVAHAMESTLTVQGGIAIPTDDMDGSDVYFGAWGLSYEAWLLKSVALGVTPYFNNMYSNDGTNWYSTSIEGVDIYAKLRPTEKLALNFEEGNFIRRISPFVSIGLGPSHYGSKGGLIGTSTPTRRNSYMLVIPNASAGISMLTKWYTTFDIGVKYDYSNKDMIDLNGTSSLNDGWITPYIGIGYHFGVLKDRDKDGILDKNDAAPNDPEDIDGFQDEDGVPDPDNDGDGILDINDGAPNQPEDKDGYMDSDGIPDPDNDGDGILDKNDGSPNQPEDKDGYKDADGIPDPDNDNDGIPDTIDRALMDAEDIDGYLDSDGVPDLDNDMDAIPDKNDKAPGTDLTVAQGIDTKETYNGFEDTDGVPDKLEEKIKDSDGDGIPDNLDKAPYDAEDKDGYMDADGIPDPDNDNDGILDKNDGAPLLPEDIDAYLDNDGIPDPDNDNDGIPDTLDKAPGTDETVRKGIDTKETYNGFEDTDGVPDKLEPTVKDSDGDGILDNVDKAPYDAEDKDNFEDSDGIPDLDNDQDRIPDVRDLAPGTDDTVRQGIDTKETYNSFEDTDGVPDKLEPTVKDSDGDGIMDNVDKAPYDAEDKDNFEDSDGVPDLDNDQDLIPDVRDLAPGTDDTVRQGIDTKETYNGFEDTDGVPDKLEPTVKDSDGDGILDNIDKAPYDPEDFDGYLDNDGIPDPDNDNDGVLDKADKAPSDAEDRDNFKDNDGIPDPDNDQDRIPDVRDLAPGTDETVRNGIDTKETYNDFEDEDGIPDVRPEAPVSPEQKELEENLFTHVVHFATNLYVIPEADKVFLDKVIESMKKLPEVRIQIQGHTDSTGNDKINIPLGLNRAKIVQAYLVNKGIEISRIEIQGFAATKPIATNDTVEGRQANRRADMIILK